MTSIFPVNVTEVTIRYITFKTGKLNNQSSIHDSGAQIEKNWFGKNVQFYHCFNHITPLGGITWLVNMVVQNCVNQPSVNVKGLWGICVMILIYQWRDFIVLADNAEKQWWGSFWMQEQPVSKHLQGLWKFQVAIVIRVVKKVISIISQM